MKGFCLQHKISEMAIAVQQDFLCIFLAAWKEYFQFILPLTEFQYYSLTDVEPLTVVTPVLAGHNTYALFGQRIVSLDAKS